MRDEEEERPTLINNVPFVSDTLVRHIDHLASFQCVSLLAEVHLRRSSPPLYISMAFAFLPDCLCVSCRISPTVVCLHLFPTLGLWPYPADQQL